MTELTLASGHSSMNCTNITIIDDTDSEERQEYFSLVLEAPQQTPGGQDISMNLHTVQVAIFDDEGMCTRYKGTIVHAC